MPVKWVLHWQPNAGATVNSQILTELSQCIEIFNGVKDGRWKSILTFYRPIVREPAFVNEFPRDFIGISLPDQPNKYYFVIRGHRLVLEADSSIQTIMERLQSYKSRLSLNFEGYRYQLGDFQLRLGKIITMNSENLKGIIMEVEYKVISSIEKSREMIEEMCEMWDEVVAKRCLPGRFINTQPIFSDYSLSDHFSSLHSALQYSFIISHLLSSAHPSHHLPRS